MATLSRREAFQLFGLTAAAIAGSPMKAIAQTLTFPKGAVIRTLFKDYAPEDLAGGATLFHEHLSLGPDFGDRFRAASAAVLAAQGAPPTQRPAGPPPAPPGPDPMRDVNLMADELRQAQRDGVACLVDAGLEGAGMDLDFIREAAKKAAFPVVKGAGFYTQPFYPKEIATMSEEQLTRALIKQADEYPAGAFGEIGSWDEISAVERKVFRAVGKAHLATNLPVFTHTGIPGKSAIEQLDLLEDVGVDPKHVAIGHLGNLTSDPNVEIHRMICRRGAFVGFDRQGGQGDAQQVPLVMKLLEAGYADNLLFSSDLATVAQTKQGGGAGYAKTLTVFVPKLKAAGASDDVLRRIMEENPRRFLAFVPRMPRRV